MPRLDLEEPEKYMLTRTDTTTLPTAIQGGNYQGT